MFNVTINGEMYLVEESKSILDVCRDFAIDVPTFCHDARLKAAGACRICIVEVEGHKRLLSSCSTKIEDGMVIKTHSPKVNGMRKALLETMFSEHNTTCLTCEITGNCDLQNYAYEYKVDTNKFLGEAKDTKIITSNEFFYIDQSKCIMCGKCVRVCDELQGNSVLAVKNRGYKSVIDIAYDLNMQNANCVSCGNCVAVCPVDAIKPVKDVPFREWETTTVRSTCSYCGVGCQLDYKVKNNRIVDIKPAMDAWNKGLLCVKGRFAYQYVNDKNRLTTPLIKKDGKFEEASWEEAYSLIASKFKKAKQEHGPDKLGVISSAKITNEESYLAQKLARAVIGTNNVDHCSRL